eukprot:scaffold7557_cov146-Skeletonema_menzelii.AAC.1
MLLLYRELLSLILIIVALAASSNSAAASTSERQLRGSSDGANFVEEHPSLLVDSGERRLKPDHATGGGGGGGGGGGNGGGKGKPSTETAPTEEPVYCTEQFEPVCDVDGNQYSNSCYASLASAEIDCEEACPCPSKLLTEGGAEAPTEGGDDTTTTVISETVCDPACDSSQVCARSSPSAEPQCYASCSGFPIAVDPRDDASCTDTCVYSTFTCGGVESVFNEFCECGNTSDGSYEDGCRPSECGLAIRQ